MRTSRRSPCSKATRLLLPLALLLAGGGGGCDDDVRGLGDRTGGKNQKGVNHLTLSLAPLLWRELVRFGGAGNGPVLAAAAEANDNPLSITTATTSSGAECSVGPYGWFCDPPAVETDVLYYAPRLFEGELGATPEGLPPLCVDECTPDCRPPCPAACVRQKFDLRSDGLLTGRAGVLVKYEFYVNPYNGSDAWPGTRSEPWETLKRAEAQVRFLRVQNTEEPDSSKLLDPVQIWIRSFDPSQEEDTDSQMDNSRYMGYTISE